MYAFFLQPFTHVSRRIFPDAMLILLLAMAGLKLTCGLEHVLDIGLYDESGYLYAGVNLPEMGLMPPAWAPFYGVWYFFLSFFTSDTITLYYLNYRVMTILPTVLFYLVLRMYSASWWVALLLAWSFLIAMVNVPTWPKPSHFALCLVLGFLMLARDTASPTRSTLFMAIGALLCSYVRPEFFLTSVALIGVYAVLLWQQRSTLYFFNEFVTAAFALLAAFALIALCNLAILDTQNNRSFEAFGQHFALNWNTWNDPDIDPWVNYQQAVQTSFGDVDSISAALRSNPGIFLRHVLANVLNTPATLFLFFTHYNILLPASHSWTTGLEAYLLLSILAGGIVLAIRTGQISIKDAWRQHRLHIIFCALFMLPGVVSAVLIYPRNHYLLVPGVLIGLAGVLLLRKPRTDAVTPGGRRQVWYTAFLGLLLLGLTPNIALDWYVAQGIAANQLANVRTIQLVRSLQIDQPVNVLEADGGYYIYLGQNFHRVPHYSKDDEFYSFLATHEIKMVIVSSGLRSDWRYANDPAWQDFMDHPAEAGYTCLKVPGTDREILIRSDWLPMQ